MSTVQRDTGCAQSRAADPPRWPSNGLSPMGPQRQPGLGEPGSRRRGSSEQPPILRVPRAHQPRIKRVPHASYAGAGAAAPQAQAGALSLSLPLSPPAPAGRLGNNVSNSVDDLGGEISADDSRRRARLAMRATGRRVTRLKSRPRDGGPVQYPLAKCGVVRISASGNVRLKVAGGTGYAEGVAHCGSIHGCAVCAANIRNRRAQIYSASAARWLIDDSTLLMVSLTFPHDMGMPLDPMWDLTSKGVSSTTSSQAWRDLRAELGVEVYYRRAVEVTYGAAGWHPHVHMLLYIRTADTARATALVNAYFREYWPRWITRNGYRLPNRHGVDVRPCSAGGEAGSYIVKTQEGRGVGTEIIRADLKKGRLQSRTPFEILADAGTGDEASLALWHEFEQASQGRRAITQSQGLAKILGEDEPTDQELADAEVGGDAVADVPGEVWADVIRKDIEAPLFEAARYGLPAVNDVLRRHGCGLAYVPVITERGS